MVELEAKKRQRGLGDNFCVIVKCVLQRYKSMQSFARFEACGNFSQTILS